MNKKGLALVTVLIFTLVMTILAGAILSLMTTEARLTEHQIRRIRGYYTIQAGMIDTLEELRKGTISVPGTGTATNSVTVTMDGSNYVANVTISPKNATDPLKGVSPISSTVDYKP